MFRLIAPSDDDVRSFLSGQEQSSFSYKEVGASASQLPRGYNIDHNRICLGHGEPMWRRATQAIRTWELFNLRWVRLYSSTSLVEPGSNVVLAVHHLGFYSLNACRVIYLIEDDAPVKRFGFAYGTLMEHAESGEERFTIEWDSVSGSIWYDILAFSRPRKALARLGYPVSRSLQRKFVKESQDAMLRAVRAVATSPQPSQAR